jgi:outer membrane receptor protein involved in Fe transport
MRSKDDSKYWLTETFNIGLSVNYVDEYYGDFTNTAKRVPGDYSLVRLHGSYEYKNWLVSAYVNNALEDEAILSREPASGRYPDGYVSVVDPRNIGASVTYSF